jgi:hypothetical protein
VTVLDGKEDAPWQPNEPLPANYVWGYAHASRYKAACGPVIEHVVVPDVSGLALFCTGGKAVIGTGGGRQCPKCIELVRDYLSGE